MFGWERREIRVGEGILGKKRARIPIAPLLGVDRCDPHIPYGDILWTLSNVPERFKHSHFDVGLSFRHRYT